MPSAAFGIATHADNFDDAYVWCTAKTRTRWQHRGGARPLPVPPQRCGGTSAGSNSPCASPNSRSRRVAVREDISRVLRTASGRAAGAAPLVIVNRAAERRAWKAMLERMAAMWLIGAGNYRRTCT